MDRISFKFQANLLVKTSLTYLQCLDIICIVVRLLKALVEILDPAGHLKIH
jgi:hypothetical protein